MKYFLLISIFLTSIFSQGQMDKKNIPDSEKMEIRKKRMEQFQNNKESTMIGVQASYLKLTPEQAQVFFPMQNDYKEKVRQAQKKYREKIGKLRSKSKDGKKFDIDLAIKYQFDMKEELAKLESQFLKNTMSILSNEQRTKLLFQQERMKSYMKKNIQNKKPEMSKRNFDRKK